MNIRLLVLYGPKTIFHPATEMTSQHNLLSPSLEGSEMPGVQWLWLWFAKE